MLCVARVVVLCHCNLLLSSDVVACLYVANCVFVSCVLLLCCVVLVVTLLCCSCVWLIVWCVVFDVVLCCCAAGCVDAAFGVVFHLVC